MKWFILVCIVLLSLVLAARFCEFYEITVSQLATSGMSSEMIETTVYGIRIR